ncbi:pentapeptide repeat-containing protein [Paracoccus salsus]|uniref:pentapeptide repeat-containing protein n=1 Tax=Paracoccus salsus TaxID=2911061 RepID=UPI001F3E5254|nr:pentapeptide repeat-containing protein [Paracoccus salsus]MCF3974057.1 pentapeptide repeat-containing protein [Paracoccus salsus]
MSRPKPPPKTLLDWLGLRQAPEWSVARPLGGLVTVVLALLFAVALAAAMVLLVRTIGGGEGSLGTGALIVALLSAPFLIWNTVIRHRALEFQKEGHLTDRLAKAVEQLGAEKTVKKIVRDAAGQPIKDKDLKVVVEETTEPNLEVRIGGLLSLERIAQDSTAYDQGRDHVRVMEIICAYIRNNAPAKDARDFPLRDLDPLPDDATPDQRKTHLAYVNLRRYAGGNLREWSASLPKPREDIMLALSILERRSDRQRRIEAAHGRDDVVEAPWVFAEPWTRLPDRPEGQAHGADVIEAFKRDLRNWRDKLWDYGGYRPDLRRTCLQGADLSRFRLAGSRLNGARLEGATLVGARLQGANLLGARLDGADLRMARLDGAELWWARLDGAFLWKARLEGAELWRARLQGANLRMVRLVCTSLGASAWDGAALKEVDLSSASEVTREQVQSSFGDASVILPDHLRPPPGHWPDWNLGIQEFDDQWRLWQADRANYRPPPRPAPDQTG